MTAPPWSVVRELAGLPPGKAARRVAGAAYRRAGALGARALEEVTGRNDQSRRLPDSAFPPWEPLPEPGGGGRPAGVVGAAGAVGAAGPGAHPTGATCVLCRWHGATFADPGHVELSLCPGCGANGRDRFLHWCLRTRVDLHASLRVIECSPRLGETYRAAMSTWFFYRTSDYDERAHRGNLRLDLQDIDLADDSVDVMLCAHVLEHVPDTGRALAELRRVLAPGGHLLLQVPLLQARTAPPATPEFHGDDTPVFWRYGFDLTACLRAAGFRADLLCTQALLDALAAGHNPWPEWSDEFDLPDILAGAVRDDLVMVADRAQAGRFGFDPGYMYLTWDCTPS